MNIKFASIVALSFIVIGCAHNAPPANTPTNTNDDNNPAMGEPPARPSGQCPSCSNDNFDKVGNGVAISTRFVWDESKKAYTYLTSEEMHQRAVSAYDEAVKISNEADAAVKAAYKAWQDYETAQKNDNKK